MDVATSNAPSWTTHETGTDRFIFAAWKGEGSDPGIYVSRTLSLLPVGNVPGAPISDPFGAYTFQSPATGGGVQFQIPNISTSVSPAITSLNGTLYLFWRGESDSAIYWASSPDGANWTDLHQLTFHPQTLGGTSSTITPLTSNGPKVVSGNGTIFLFWKGATTSQLFWSTFSGGKWS